MRKSVQVLSLQQSLEPKDIQEFYSNFCQCSFNGRVPTAGRCYQNAQTALFLDEKSELDTNIDKYVLGVFINTQNNQEMEHAWNKTKDGLYIDIDPNLGYSRNHQYVVQYELTKEDFREILNYVNQKNDNLFDIGVEEVEKFLKAKWWLKRLYWKFKLTPRK